MFATGGPNGFLEGALVKPALTPQLAENSAILDAEGNEMVPFLKSYCRDLPYGRFLLLLSLSSFPFLRRSSSLRSML